MTGDRVLITGADGYLGRRIARRYLERDGIEMVLWVRAADAAAFESKRKTLDDAFGSFGRRVRFAWGDLTGDEPFSGIEPDAIRTIVHSAAVTRFNVDAETALRVNVEGAEKLLRFAARCEGLQGLGLLSTVYASGLRSGPIAEAPFPRGDFANHYESSKWAAEDLLLSDYADLPWRIFRVATVLADDDDGTVGQYNAVHNTLQLLYYGLVSTLPGIPRTPVYLVTGEMAADAVVRILTEPPGERIYHLSPRREQSLTLDQLVTIAFDVFEEGGAFRKRRIPRPLYVDAESFDLLHRAITGFSGGLVGQAVGSVAPFARQLFVTKEILNANLIAALGRDPAPDPARLARRTCEYLVRTRWGRETTDAA